MYIKCILNVYKDRGRKMLRKIMSFLLYKGLESVKNCHCPLCDRINEANGNKNK